MRSPSILAVLLSATLAAGAHASTLVRCEDARGRVTYSDAPCPPDARITRAVDNSPPVVARDGKDAPSRADVAPRAGRIEPSRSIDRSNPVQEDEKLTAEFRAQQRECDEQARRLQFLQLDADTASPTARSSAELTLRRAQEVHRQQCPRR